MLGCKTACCLKVPRWLLCPFWESDNCTLNYPSLVTFCEALRFWVPCEQPQSESTLEGGRERTLGTRLGNSIQNHVLSRQWLACTSNMIVVWPIMQNWQFCTQKNKLVRNTNHKVLAQYIKITRIRSFLLVYLFWVFCSRSWGRERHSVQWAPRFSRENSPRRAWTF